MDVKIGIQHIGREVSVDTELTADEVEKALTKALDDDGVLTLADVRGRKVIIPAARIAYVELGEENARRVGFGSV